jgi:hypothetical protein
MAFHRIERRMTALLSDLESFDGRRAARIPQPETGDCDVGLVAVLLEEEPSEQCARYDLRRADRPPHLSPGIRQRDVSGLGMSPAAVAIFERAIRQPYGGILVFGPTGSGKTTTLYIGALNQTEPTVDVFGPPQYLAQICLDRFKSFLHLCRSFRRTSATPRR